jgi:SNF2 family DNA or RNA helicase
VLSDLPEKTEQTLFVELGDEQRKRYDELREHFRLELAGRIGRVGMGRARIAVLEALLRLRQAACHPGLIDPARVDDPGAKIETLLEQLEEVLDEGHKALVFSQFTSFLSILRRRLDERKTVYEYLDGRTTDRQARVQRFQEDPDCRLFLVSLKAGGQGLNLTAADYIYILDPWWNPAVEAQAVDRAHRIGQTRRVFAYRLIARDTVEEKIVALQDRKRELAESIVRADDGVVAGLTAEDVELLFS